jgi:lipoprotein-anchoring transpeptidase ErfK/SrfK
LVGINLKVNSSPVSGGITYKAHVANVGWLSSASNGASSASGSNAVQAIQISLTGDLSKYFDVYYQSHVAGYGWMGWAKNGASSGTTGLSKNLEAYRVKLVPKGAAAPGSTAKSYSDKNGFLGVNSRYTSIANKYSSGSSWLILVDLSAHKTVIMSGRQGSWSVSRSVSCVTGAASTPTIRGKYTTTGYKRPALSTDSRATYCTQISGGYFFHTILASNSELGKSLSHGCVRLAVTDARWIYNNIPKGTTVVLY